MMLTLVQLDQHSPTSQKAFEQFIQDQIPFAIEILPLCGSWDYQLRIVARNNTHYGQMLERLADHKGVTRIRSHPTMGRGSIRPIPLDELMRVGVGN